MTSTDALPVAGAAPAELRHKTSREQPVLGPWLRAQALNASRHAAALRDFIPGEFGDGPESPSEGHIASVNAIIRELRKRLLGRTRELDRLVRTATEHPNAENLRRVVKNKHVTLAQVREIERIWDFYLELFGQRQSRFGAWLLGCDRIAQDCYQVAYTGIGVAKSIPAPAPFNYMRTGFGPATFRRAVRLPQLSRQLNPFPLIQLPYHRLVNPWTLGAILHEVSHNLHSDLGLSRAVPLAIGRALVRAGLGIDVAKIWMRWNRETFADLSAVLLGGPAVVASLMDVVGIDPKVVSHYNEDGVHPIPYLRVPLSAEVLRRIGFEQEAERYLRAWRALYPRPSGDLPERLLTSAPKAMATVVETVCFRPFKELGDKSLSQVFRFAQKEQRITEETARRLAQGNDPGIVPERFLIGAARFAIDNRLAPAARIRENFYRDLEKR